MAMIVEIPEPMPKSAIRAGGSPALDRAYLDWRSELVERANTEWLDRHFPGELPSRELVAAWGLDEHLFLATGGSRLFWAESEVYHHRLRHLAIELRDDPRRLLRLALHYISSRERPEV